MKHFGKFEVEYQKSRLEIDFDTLIIGINNIKDYGISSKLWGAMDRICILRNGRQQLNC